MKKSDNNVTIERATVIETRRTKYRKGTYMIVSQITLRRILSEKEIFTNEVLRVLFGLLGVIRYDGGTDITHQKLAELIGLHRPQVSRALKVLEENDIIYKDGRSWYIDDKLVFKGVEHEVGSDDL